MTSTTHQHSTTKPEIDMPEIAVNGHRITSNDIAMEMQYHPAKNPQLAVEQAAQALVIKHLLLERAAELGLANEAGGGNSEALIGQLIEKEAASPLATDDDCLRYFGANRTCFRSSDLIEVKHILLAADPEKMEHKSKVKALAFELLAQLRGNIELFADLATEYSACPSKEAGGCLGQVSKGQTVPEFERAIFRAEEGLLDNPVETPYGYHLVFIDRKIPGKQLEFDLVKEKVRQYLNETSQRIAIKQYISLLIGEAEITGIDLDAAQSPLLQ